MSSPELPSHYREERLPRYTSYPTAPQFTDGVGPRHYADWLEALDGSVVGSLYLHVPFCRSMCWYCGCHTTITKHDAPVVHYLDVLRREVGLVAARLTRPLRVGHVHFGGGTPTIMAPEEFASILGLLRRSFNWQAGCEVAVEIDPRTLTKSMTAALGASGVTRASLGVQSFDPVVQKAINRIQSVAQTASATEGLRRSGVSRVNFDLIYGLPHQTVRSCVDTVAQCVAMRPDRFAVFGYAHIPSFKKHQRMIAEDALPGGSARHEQSEVIGAALVEAGYRRIGLDHYALPEDELVRAQEEGTLRRNFQGYTTDGANALIGFGASAIGHLPQGYVQNEVHLGAYAERVGGGDLAASKGYALTPEDRVRADVIERIMCDFAVDLAEVGRRHGADASGLLAAAARLPELVADGLASRRGSVIEVAPPARHLVRTVASSFDAYLGLAGRAHSRAI